MINYLLKSIKSEKKFTFQHWRYRVLHWAFGVNPEDPGESPLPMALYTHYCPLFHLTNFIVLFCWVVAGWKLCRLIFSLFVAAGVQVNSLLQKHLAPRLSAMMQKSKKDKAAKEIDPAVVLKKERRRELGLLISRLTNNPHWIDSVDPKERYDAWGFNAITKEEFVELWKHYGNKIKKDREVAEERRKKLQAWIVFWANFSRVFIKGFLNVFYTALFVGAVYVFIRYGIPFVMLTCSAAVWLFKALLDVDYFYVGKVMSMILGGIAGLIGLVVLAKLSPKPFNWAKHRVLPPLELVGDVIESGVKAVRKWCVDTIEGILEFCSVFYEENCPPIEIVDADEIPHNIGDA